MNIAHSGMRENSESCVTARYAHEFRLDDVFEQNVRSCPGVVFHYSVIGEA